MSSKTVIEDGKKFYIKVSTRKNKKYDVFKTDNSYLLSFGDTRYEQFNDKIGHYKNLNHNDEKRREAYRKRSAGIGFLNDTNSPNFWSRKYLW